jgi:hypothetical protein
MEMWSWRSSGFVLLCCAVLAAIGIGVGIISTSDNGPSIDVAKSLAMYVESSYASATSRPFIEGGRTADLVIETPRIKNADAAAEIAVLNGSKWRILQRIRFPITYLFPGHSSAKKPLDFEWLSRFDLSRSEPAFAFYIVGASGWGGLVIARLANHWEVVPFQGGYKAVGLPYPVFDSPERVTTHFNDCSPDCARGRWTSKMFRFSQASDSFVQVGPTEKSEPPRIIPTP